MTVFHDITRTLLLPAVILCAAASEITLGDEQPPKAHGALPGMTPAVELLDRAMTFHCSFDFEVPDADVAVGATAPVRVEGTFKTAPGKYGRALLTGEGGARLSFRAQDNLSLPRPGALSFWVCPQTWRMPDEFDSRGYLVFFSASGARGGAFLVERMGFHKTLNRADRVLAGFFNFPGLPSANKNVGSRGWRNGDWHLIVVNWDRNGYALSVDGKTFQRCELARPLTHADFPPDSRHGTFEIGASGGEQTLIDDVILYQRPLSRTETVALVEDVPLPR